MLIGQIAVLSHEFQGGRERAAAFGWWGIIFGIGLGFGPIIGGGIAALLSWEWVFLVHVVFAVVALALAVTGVHESKDPRAGQLDDELAREHCGLLGEVRIDALLPAVRGIGAKAEALRGAQNRNRLEVGCFE